MQFPRFEHARFLAKGWSRGPPRHNLGASAFVPDDPLEGLPTTLEPGDVGHFDLHAGTAFRAAVARHLGLPEEMVRGAAGTSGANAAAIAHLVEPGCNVVCERPYYAPLPHAAAGLGADVRFVERGADGSLEPAAVADAMDDATALVLLTSPHNPTGHALDEAALRVLGDAAERHDAWVLVDQVYRELTDHPVAAGLHPRLFTTASLNKCWGAPGLRAGWIAGDPQLVDGIEETHRILLLGASSLGARLGTVLLGHAAARRAAMERRLEANHATYHAWCGEQSIDPAAGALTAFPRVPVEDTWAFAEAALDDGLLTIPGEAFGRPGHIRIGLGIPTGQLRPALDALAARW